MIPENIITQTEAAQRLGVSRQTLWAWRTAGKGPKVVMIGERPQYDATEVEAFAAQRLAAWNAAQRIVAERKLHQRAE